jgi:hypothetical protein
VATRGVDLSNVEVGVAIEWKCIWPVKLCSVSDCLQSHPRPVHSWLVTDLQFGISRIYLSRAWKHTYVFLWVQAKCHRQSGIIRGTKTLVVISFTWFNTPWFTWII